jgi:hypothetical protein
MENLNKYVGKVIESVVLGSDDALHFVFADGTKMKLWDDGQSCCESRYMMTDDNLLFYSGTVLVNVEVRDAPDTTDEYDNVHEVQFLEVMTNRGCFTMTTHNEHNGYYGGFYVRMEAE